MAVGSLGDERKTALHPTMGARHIGFRPGFVDEDEALGVKLRLDLLARAMARDVGPILFGGI